MKKQYPWLVFDAESKGFRFVKTSPITIALEVETKDLMGAKKWDIWASVDISDIKNPKFHVHPRAQRSAHECLMFVMVQLSKEWTP